MKYEYPSFRIDKTDFLKGNNSYNDFPDGGFLSSTVGVNVFGKPGLLTQAPALGNSVTTSLPQNGMVSCSVAYSASDPVIFASMVSGSQQMTWWTVNAGTGAFTALTGYDSTGGRTYTIGLTDTVFYNGKMYTSAPTDIVEQNVDGSARDLSWWVTTKGKTALTSGVPHPMLVYESILYIADGKYLHKVDGTTCTSQVFDCPPNYVITAMTEFNGLIYLVAEPYISADGQIHGGAIMFSWDGTTNSWFEQYFINYRVNAMYVYKNRLFMWTNQFMGQWDGSKIVPLKPVSYQVFKCHITETSDSLLYADGPNIVRFGAPFVPGASEKFYSYLNSGIGNNWTGIISVKNNNLIAVEHAGVTSSSYNYYISNINTPTTSGYRILNLNPRFFNKTVRVKRVVVEMEALASGQTVYPWFINDQGSEIVPTYKSGIIQASDSTQNGKTYFEFEFSNKKNTRSVQPRLYLFGNPYIRSVDYFYEPTEQGLSK